jgi:2-haloacid dehalogenase
MKPRLVTLDIFGTVLDWRRGLSEAVAAQGRALGPGEFDRIVDRQGELEQREPFRSYRDLTAQSLVEVLGLLPAAAEAIGERVGTWPAYPDSGAALQRLMAIAPCAAMTNSDRAHGVQVQRGFGFELAAWICAEDVRRYKPAPRFWSEVSARLGVEPGPGWWHVSAYADDDLRTAGALGLTTVFVDRSHARPGPAHLRAADLLELAQRGSAATKGRVGAAVEGRELRVESLQAQKDMKELVKHDHAVVVRNDETVTIQNNQTFAVGTQDSSPVCVRKFEGQGVCRLGDPLTHNKKNAVG